MIIYPKQDHAIDLQATDNSKISGMINVLGRSISTYLQGTEPDIIMYDCKLDDETKVDTLIVSKDHTLWINTGEPSGEDRAGNWQRLVFRMVNGAIIKGDVNITGYDRVSDYLQNFDDRFYEVYSAETKEGHFGVLYVSRIATLWKEPVA